jgi:hypothetical protein
VQDEIGFAVVVAVQYLPSESHTRAGTRPLEDHRCDPSSECAKPTAPTRPPDDLPSDTEAEQVTDVRPAHRATPTSCRPASDLRGEAPCYAHLIDEAAAGFRPAESPE